MRKAVKLAAVSAVAAVAMVGAPATAATAHGYQDPETAGFNTCGNKEGSLAEADRVGEAETGDIEDNVTSNTVICQNGEENYAKIVNENEREGLLDNIVDLLPIGSPGTPEI